MNYVALLIVAAIPFTFPAHAAAGQTGETTTTASASTRIAAELTKKIDTKDAKVGDAVLARTTADATLADGTMLPRGSRLTGSVTEVRAKSNEAKNSHLAITFNRAIVPDGHEIPLHTTLRSMAAPAQLAGSGNLPDMSTGASGAAGAPALGSGSVSTGRNHGAPMGGLAGAGAAAEIPSNRPTRLDDPRVDSASATGDYVHDALQLHHYPVANMPGVILSSQVTASASGTLDASGQNIRLESGTTMTMDASIAAR